MRVGVYNGKVCVVRAIPKNIPLILCDFIKYMYDLYRLSEAKSARAQERHGYCCQGRDHILSESSYQNKFFFFFVL